MQAQTTNNKAEHKQVEELGDDTAQFAVGVIQSVHEWFHAMLCCVDDESNYSYDCSAHAWFIHSTFPTWPAVRLNIVHTNVVLRFTLLHKT